MKGGEHMGTSATKAKLKYNTKAYDQLKIQVKKGKREEYKAYAESKGISLTNLIIQLIENEMKNNK